MNNPYVLDEKTILVTGASSGIGRSIAITLAELGASVCGAARNKAELMKTFEHTSSPDKHLAIPTDLGEANQVSALAKEVPPLEGLVLNAGFVKTMPAKFIKEDVLEDLFKVNIQSSILLVKALLKNKKLKSGASIVFISSMASAKPTKGNSAYAASKGAVNAYSRALALELSDKHIRVNTVLPGFVESNLMDGGALDTDNMSDHMKKYPLGRYGKPEDVAYLVAYLLSDTTKWMTGSEIRIDGGFSLT